VNANVIMVKCSNGHRFPVNLDKHQDRNYRICPRPNCGARVKVKTSIWSPNARWARIKAEREQALKEERERRRQSQGLVLGPRGGPAILMQGER
jgi:hypothetical protein